MWNWMQRSEQNSVKEIVAFLNESNFKSETELQEGIWGYYRGGRYVESNKKYADLLRRGLLKGLYKRVAIEGKRHKYVYYV